jgi:hypothetical protein
MFLLAAKRELTGLSLRARFAGAAIQQEIQLDYHVASLLLLLGTAKLVIVIASPGRGARETISQ